VSAAAAGAGCSEGSTAWGTELTPENPDVTETVDADRGGAGKEAALCDDAAAAAAVDELCTAPGREKGACVVGEGRGRGRGHSSSLLSGWYE
jgi:hypothetical protein